MIIAPIIVVELFSFNRNLSAGLK